MSQIAIMDALVDVLNGLTLSQPLNAVRSNQPVDHLESANELTTVVFPGPRTISSINRGAHQKQYEIFIAIMKKIDPRIDEATRTAQQDVLMSLAEETENIVYQTHVVGMAVFDFSQQFVTAPFIENELSDKHKFMSIIPTRYTIV